MHLLALRLMRTTLSALSLLVLFAAQGHAQIATAPAAASPRDDGDWRMPTKDYANTRYSELNQISRDNVRQLQVAYTFSTETLKGQESPVLAVKGMLYFTTSYPNYLIAIDLSKPGGEVKWKFDP